MEKIGKVSHWVFHIGGTRLVVNNETLIMTWVVIILTLVFAWLATRGRAMVPGPWQQLAELLVQWFRDLVRDALGDAYEARYFPLICALFIFLILCNWIGIIPGLTEPTKDLNTPLGLGIMGFFIAHGTAIRAKGFSEYLKEYFRPIFFLMPLNVVGELAKVISISFRLFGNIMGGQHHHSCSLSSGLWSGPAALFVCFFWFVCWHGAGVCLHDAHPGLYLGSDQVSLETRTKRRK